MAERSERLKTAAATEPHSAHGGESRFAVLAAMAANFAIAVGKLVERGKE